MIRILLLLSFSFITCSIRLSAQDTLSEKSGLKYVQLKAGSGPTAKAGDKIKVYYHKGTFLNNGNEFDKDISTRTIKFTLGKGEVIPGWDEGFKWMKKGERGLLIIPSQLAYGSKGVKDFDDETKYIIPPNTDLIFEVELLDIK